MKSPSIFHPVRKNFLTGQVLDSGFSMMEVLVVLGIIGMIAAFGTIAGLDMYARYNFRSEIDNAISLLQKARSESINNIGDKRHGVTLNDSTNLILFREGVPSYNLSVKKIPAAGYTDNCSGSIIFEKLSGRTTGCDITISDGVKSVTISINNEGGINY